MSKRKELPRVDSYRGTISCLDIARHLPFNLGVAFTLVWNLDFDKQEEAVKALEKALFHVYDQEVNVSRDENNPFPKANTLFHAIDILMGPENVGYRLPLLDRIVSNVLSGFIDMAETVIESLTKTTKKKHRRNHYRRLVDRVCEELQEQGMNKCKKENNNE